MGWWHFAFPFSPPLTTFLLENALRFPLVGIVSLKENRIFLYIICAILTGVGGEKKILTPIQATLFVKKYFCCYMKRAENETYTIYICLHLHACSVTQSCDPMDYSLPGSSVHRTFQARVAWSGLPFPPPGYLPNPGIKPTSSASPTLAGGFFTMEPPGNPCLYPYEESRHIYRETDQMTNKCYFA